MTTETKTLPTRSRGEEKFSLGAVTKAAKRLPNRMCMHAQGGWGKTSFVAQIPGVCFLMVGQETGLETLIANGQVKEDIPHFPEPATRLSHVFAALRSFQEPGQPHKCLAIDAGTGIQAMLQEKVCQEAFNGSWSQFNAYGGDQASKLVAKEWDPILKELDVARENGVYVVLINHSRVVNFRNPEGPDYERWEALTKHEWQRVYDWADLVLFGGFEVTTDKRDKRKTDAETKAKATGGETRVLHCQRNAAFDAKNRHGLPPMIECGNSAVEAWTNFVAALRAGKDNK
jgi:hypothetical protein